MHGFEGDTFLMSPRAYTGEDIPLFEQLALQRQEGVYLFFPRNINRNVHDIPLRFPLVLQNLYSQLLHQIDQGKRFFIIGSMIPFTIVSWAVLDVVRQRFPHVQFYWMPLDAAYLYEGLLPTFQQMKEALGEPVNICPWELPKRANQYYERISHMCSTVLLYSSMKRSSAAVQQFSKYSVEMIGCMEQVDAVVNDFKELQASIFSTVKNTARHTSMRHPVKISLDRIQSIVELTGLWNAKCNELADINRMLGIPCYDE